MSWFRQEEMMDASFSKAIDSDKENYLLQGVILGVLTETKVLYFHLKIER
jgi:hypothetical protein